MRTGVATLLGRALEFERLGSLAAELSPTSGATALITGPAGIGKTALLDQVLEGLDVPVRRARAVEGERAWAYGVARQLRLAVPERAADEGAVAYAVWSALAEGPPVVLAVDDVPWADPPSVRLLASLARQIRSLPVLLLMTARPVHEDEDVALRELRATVPAIEPGPLDATGLAMLAEQALGAPPLPGFVDALARLTGGVPLYARELLAEAIRRDEHDPAALAVLGSRAVAESVLRRAREVGPDGLALAEAVAVLGDGVELRHAAALAGVPPAAAAAALDGLAGRGVLRDEPRPAFRHDVLRSAVLAAVPAGRRGVLHAAAAGLLRAAGAAPEAVAAHLLQCPPAADPQAAASLRSAARSAAAAGAPAAAVPLLRRALAEPPPQEARPEVALELGTVEARSLDAAAEDRLRAILDDPAAPPAIAVAAGRLLGRDLVARGRSGAELRSMLDGALARAAAVAPLDRLRIVSEVCAASVLGEVVSAAELRAFGAEAESLAAQIGTPLARRLAAAARARVAVARGETAEHRAAARAAAREAADGDELLDEPWLPQAVSASLAALLDGLEEFDAAGRLVARIAAHAEEVGSTHDHGLATLTRMGMAWRRGDLDTTEAYLPRLSSGRPVPAGFAIPTLMVDLHLERGRTAEAEQVLRSGTMGEDLTSKRSGLVAEAQVQLAAGRPAAALVAARAALETTSSRGELPFQGHSEWRLIALALHALGREEEARAAAEQALEAGRAVGDTMFQGLGLWVFGRVADDLESLAEAVEVFAPSPLALGHARTRVELGAALRRRGRRVEARDELRLGLELALDCGSTVLAERAREELAAAGARLRRERISGVAALTPAELRIARLAADGRSNPEIARTLFVTRKTVEKTLSAAYGKLAVAGRGELAGALRQRRESEGPS